MGSRHTPPLLLPAESELHIRNILASTLTGGLCALLIIDGDGFIRHATAGVARLLGHVRDHLYAQSLDMLLSPNDLQIWHSQARLCLSKAAPVRIDLPLLNAQGRPLWCACQIMPCLPEHQNPSYIAMMLTDIGMSKIHEQFNDKILAALVEDKPIYDIATLLCHEAMALQPDCVATIAKVDAEGRLRIVAAPGMPKHFYEETEGMLIGPMAGSSGTAAYLGQTVVSHDIATSPLWEHHRHLPLSLGLHASYSHPIKDGNDKVVGVFTQYYRLPQKSDAMQSQLTALCLQLCALLFEREASRDEIQRLVFYDDLTGLPNRQFLQAQSRQALAAASRASSKLAFMFIDIDGFKRINDSLGTAAGNTLLKSTAHRLKGQIVEPDIVCRLSADEFIAIVAFRDMRHVVDIAGNILEQLSQPVMVGNVPVHPSVCIGISTYPEDGQDTEQLISRASMALDQAKTSGRNRWNFFDNAINEATQEHIALEAALHDALDNVQLRLYYQPQIDLRDGSLHGFEALTRWYHPKLGHVPPTLFIRIAENCGLIDRIGIWSITEACQQLQRWRSTGVRIPSISVNLSPNSLHDAALPTKIGDILWNENLSPQDLILEITENVLLDNHPDTLRTLDAIHRLGIRLALDDFGTGYSSLGYLRRLPVCAIKLDKSYVHGMDTDITLQALTRAILHIGDSMQLPVVAEGIETASHLAQLTELGYHIGQGYLFSHPLPAHAVPSWIEINTPWIS
ncbi:EAL domain-containing protein [Alcaligenaceae bacterium SJ-26]|nr:EAL domain-containing protein [Alcaligenaceae bacterium SJ-26]